MPKVEDILGPPPGGQKKKRVEDVLGPPPGQGVVAPKQKQASPPRLKADPPAERAGRPPGSFQSARLPDVPGTFQEGAPKKVENILGPPAERAGPQPAPAWGDVISNIPSHIASGFQQAAGGLTQMFGEGQLPSTLPGKPRPQIPEVAEKGSEVVKAGRQKQAEATLPGETFWQRAVTSGVSSAAQNLPFAAFGPGGMLTAAGAQTAGRAYGKAREAGVDPATSMRHATASGLIEAGTEALPAKFLFKKGTGPFKRLVKFLAVDIPGENVSEVSQRVSEQLHDVSEDVTAGELISLVKDTSAATLIGGGLQSGLASGAHAVMGRRQAQPPTEQPPPQQAGEPRQEIQPQPMEAQQPTAQPPTEQTPPAGLPAGQAGGQVSPITQPQPQQQALPGVGALPPISTVGAARRRERLEAEELLDREAVLETEQDIPDLIPGLNLGKMETSDDVKIALMNVQEAFPEIDEARQAPITWDETNEEAMSFATAAGTDLETLKKWFPKKMGESTAQLRAAQTLLLSSAENLTEEAIRLNRGQATDLDLTRFGAMLDQHTMIQETFSAARSEAGRMLNILRQPVPRGQDIAGIKQLLEGERYRLEDAAGLIAEMAETGRTPDEISGVARQRGPDWYDKLLEYWYNSILSGPKTHAVNILGNTLVQVWEAGAVTPTAAAMGAVTRRPDRVTFTEAKGKLFGTMKAIPEAFHQAVTSFKTERPTVGAQLEPVFRQAIGGKLGKKVRIPGRALTAEDAFFGTMGYRGALYQFASRDGFKKGLRGEDLARYVNQQVSTPDAKLHKRAIDEGQRMTFTNPLGPTGRSFQTALNTRGGRYLKPLMPFIRTPTNIVKYGLHQSPLGVFTPKVRAELKEGGATRQMALARIAMGSMASLYGLSLALEGAITGAPPDDPREKDLWYRSGKQPYSARIGDRWISYNRLDPWGLQIGVIADMVNLWDRASEAEQKDFWVSLGIASANIINHKLYFTGPSDFAQAINNPGWAMSNWLQNQAASFIPNVFRQTATTQDPTLRATQVDALAEFPEARSSALFWEELKAKLKSRIPGLTKDLPARIDIFGEPIRYGDALGPDVISPLYGQAADTDPLAQELMDMGITIPRLDNRIDGEPLPPEEFEELSQHVGKRRREMFARATPYLRRLPDEVRKDIASKLSREGRRLGIVDYKIDKLSPRGRKPPPSP